MPCGATPGPRYRGGSGLADRPIEIGRRIPVVAVAPAEEGRMGVRVAVVEADVEAVVVACSAAGDNEIVGSSAEPVGKDVLRQVHKYMI